MSFLSMKKAPERAAQEVMIKVTVIHFEPLRKYSLSLLDINIIFIPSLKTRQKEKIISSISSVPLLPAASAQDIKAEESSDAIFLPKRSVSISEQRII